MGNASHDQTYRIPTDRRSSGVLGRCSKHHSQMGSPWRTTSAPKPSEWIPTVQARGSQEGFGKSRKTANVKKLNDSIEQTTEKQTRNLQRVFDRWLSEVTGEPYRCRFVASKRRSRGMEAGDLFGECPSIQDTGNLLSSGQFDSSPPTNHWKNSGTVPEFSPSIRSYPCETQQALPQNSYVKKGRRALKCSVFLDADRQPLPSGRQKKSRFQAPSAGHFGASFCSGSSSCSCSVRRGGRCSCS